MKIIWLLLSSSVLSGSALYGQEKNADLIRQFAETSNDSIFISRYSKLPYKKVDLQPSAYPHNYESLDSTIFYTGSPGKFIGPVIMDKVILLIKIIEVDSALRMRAGNIWLSPEKRGAENIDKLAEDILRRAKATGNFDTLCKQYCDDSNQNFDADLGWFYQGAMVSEFEEAVLKHKKGDIFIASTRYGKHIVKILENPVLDRSKVSYVFLCLDKN